MYTAKYQSRFKKHYQNLIRAGRFTKKEFETAQGQILRGGPLDQKYDDHVVKSRKPERAFFIKGSWLALYSYEGDTAKFLDVGRHGDM
ncbi:type II toxin-antitoxin system YafQ family toxin [Lentilactobacillus sp. Marseille-Q4993]|uniref:type II toxin-antitoxin system RelE/ParE family toxin n=1 Tax=Lentilactobacillus sp. Marseille-Q4993 TaxID=3039492 RepID=UPI0024BD5059|nr:type II toxin-antitoxin system YafQ family toxin [Lentilactobacillus sp. Marseille-Q4993]